MARIIREYDGTLTEALTSPNIIVSGNRLLLRGGIYNISADIVCLLSNVTIMAYPGETVTIKSTGGTVYMLLFGANSNNMTLDNLILEGDPGVPTTAIKATDGSYGLTVRNCEVKNFTGQGILLTNGNGITNNVLIEDSHFHHNGGSDTFVHNIYASITGLTIRRCECDHGGGWGIHGFNGHDGDSVVIENCYCHDNYVGIGAYYGNFTVRNCVSRNNTLYSISLKYGIQTANIQFNTCTSQLVVDELEDKSQVIEISNNVILSENSDQALFLSGRLGMTTAHYNLVHGASTDLYKLNSTYTTEENNIYEVFTPITDDTAENIKPAVGNPAIGAGISVSGVTADYGGNLRNNPPTIGAWE